MKVNVPLENGFLADRYSKYASKAQRDANGPIISFPVTVEAFPAATVAWGLTLLDFDAVPVSGFPWIHWLAANISATTTQLPENASRKLAPQFVQGKNSLASPFITNTDELATQRYTGPTPPDKTHQYQLTVYALDQQLALTDGYWLNEFYHASQNHVLAKAQIDLPSRA